MTSPREKEQLPKAIPTLWRSMLRARRAEPRLVTVSLALALLQTVPEALVALWLKFLTEGIVGSRPSLVLWAALGLGASVLATWVLRVVGGRLQRKFRMRIGIALEADVAELQASIPTIEHQERPEYLDRLSVLRDQVFQLDHMYLALFSTLGALVRLLITVGLLMSVSPLLGLLLLFAVPTVLVSSWRSGVQRVVEEKAAPHMRLARHLFVLGTTAPPAKEVRLDGIGQRLASMREAAARRWYGPVASAQWASAIWQSLSWALFGVAYVGAVAYVVFGLQASPGDVILVLAAGGSLAQYVGTTAGEADFLRMWLDAAQRLVWLENYAAEHPERTDQPVPRRLSTGIRFEDVNFRYPGSDPWVLKDVNLTVPAGAVLAIVGENGAGKSTLVKLLCGFYAPTTGRITVDGVDVGAMPAREWRNRLAGAFQDFVRFELKAQQSIGVGDLDHVDDREHVTSAAHRGAAGDVVEQLPAGLDTQLGPTWTDGVDLSFGQWQKVALARGYMREDPLVVVLDEPTAALDAETEHALFEKYVEGARAGVEDGRVTILVSHRFSTVRMADLIVVLNGSRVAEVGSHEELMANGGTYAELYGIQARAYK